MYETEQELISLLSQPRLLLQWTIRKRQHHPPFLLRGISFLQVILGTLYGLLDGFIGGLILGWLYNLFSGQGSAA